MYRWSVSYNIGGSGKNAVSIDHHNHVTKKKVEKLRYVLIFMKL